MQACAQAAAAALCTALPGHPFLRAQHSALTPPTSCPPATGCHTAWQGATSLPTRTAAKPCPSTCRHPAAASAPGPATGQLQRRVGGGRDSGTVGDGWHLLCPRFLCMQRPQYAPRPQYVAHCKTNPPTFRDEALATPLGHHPLNVLLLRELAQRHRSRKLGVPLLSWQNGHGGDVGVLQDHGNACKLAFARRLTQGGNAGAPAHLRWACVRSAPRARASHAPPPTLQCACRQRMCRVD